MSMHDLPAWKSIAAKRIPISFQLELTARCNNNCRHCYINLPAEDDVARQRELTASDIIRIAEEARELGALWCLLTGGEPLLRADFVDIYLGLKKLGLLVSVFTNACLINAEHAHLFKQYPPRDIEVTVYGVTRATYEQVSRSPGSFESFRAGLDLLTRAGVRVRLKAMLLHSNRREWSDIDSFCRERTKDFFRSDPLLHMRYDSNRLRNEEIAAERLSADDVVAVDLADEDRARELRRQWSGAGMEPEASSTGSACLFGCSAGDYDFAVGYDGTFRLCPSLCHPDTTHDLRAFSLRHCVKEWTPAVRGLVSWSPRFTQRCGRCSLAHLCFWCPAHAALETGDMDEWVEYFCEVTHARQRVFGTNESEGAGRGSDGG